MKRCLISFFAGLLLPPCFASAANGNPAILTREFLAEPPVTPSSHASTIVATKSGLVAAWSGGSNEGNPDVGIFVARQVSGNWQKPIRVADGVEDGPTRHPCWNPVLFQPREGPLLLFYKVGSQPHTWWGRCKSSTNNGITWSKSRRLPKDFLGPVRNKPVEIEDGILLCGSSTEDAGWRVHMERVQVRTWTWKHSGLLNHATEFGAIQPTILVWPGATQILCRSRHGIILQGWSHDGGRTWDRLKRTTVPNPDSAIDAVMLHDGRALLVYNPTNSSRNILSVGLSTDAKTWPVSLDLENESTQGEFSDPAVIQSPDGLVHITYTWQRKNIHHVVLDPRKLK